MVKEAIEAPAEELVHYVVADELVPFGEDEYVRAMARIERMRKDGWLGTPWKPWTRTGNR